MTYPDSTLFPEIANQQSHGNNSTSSDEQEVVQANSGPQDSTLFAEIANQQSQDNISTSSDESGPRVEVKSYLNSYRAATKGDWETIERILDENPNALTASINERGDTLLHVVVEMGHTSVVQRLLAEVSQNGLEKQNFAEQTVLHTAAIGGDLEIIRALVDKNPRLTQFTDNAGYTPLARAAQYSNEEVIRYLRLKTNDDAPGRPFTGPSSGEVLVMLIVSGLYDVALRLLQQYPRLAVTHDIFGSNFLVHLAKRPFDFLSGSKFRRWELWIYQMVPVEKKEDIHYIPRSDEEDQRHQNLHNGTRLLLFRKQMGQVLLTWINKMTWKVMKDLVPRIKHIEQEKLKHIYTNKLIHYACEVMTDSEEFDLDTIKKELSKSLFTAAVSGIVEIVTICCQHFPSLFWLRYDSGHTIFELAIQHRRQKIVNLLYAKIAINKQMSSNSKDGFDTMLHAAAKLAPLPQIRSIPCPAIQMQREIQWFKAVESLSQPFQRNWKNRQRQTADELFTIEHTKLVEKAEKWMKDTSNSCMLVSTLIATVVFAAAFTVPGGNVEGKGTPIFLKEATFMTFAISDALALFFSTTSILMFLSILTARYAEQDFLYALPKRLILGLASLFLAIAAMMVAFGSALQIMLGERWEWIYIPTMLLGALPVSLFMMLQFPLFVEMIWSTYGPSIFRPERIW